MSALKRSKFRLLGETPFLTTSRKPKKTMKGGLSYSELPIRRTV